VKRLLAVASLLFAATPALAGSGVPVMAGGNDEGFDACGSSATISVSSFVSVRNGPGTQYQEIDKVYDGQNFIICEDRNTGSGLKDGWFGIVYATGKEKDCFGSNDLWKHRRPYIGPCRFGWVHKRYTSNWAG
jgi:hypothetical protein